MCVDDTSGLILPLKGIVGHEWLIRFNATTKVKVSKYDKVLFTIDDKKQVCVISKSSLFIKDNDIETCRLRHRIAFDKLFEKQKVHRITIRQRPIQHTVDLLQYDKEMDTPSSLAA